MLKRWRGIKDLSSSRLVVHCIGMWQEIKPYSDLCFFVCLTPFRIIKFTYLHVYYYYCYCYYSLGQVNCYSTWWLNLWPSIACKGKITPVSTQQLTYLVSWARLVVKWFLFFFIPANNWAKRVTALIAGNVSAKTSTVNMSVWCQTVRQNKRGRELNIQEERNIISQFWLFPDKLV